MFPPLSIKPFTYCLCFATGLAGLLENGCVRLNLLTLERRFGLTSSQLALILAAYEVTMILFLIPFTYFAGGSRHDKPKIISIGLLFIGLGALILSLPQFYSPTSSDFIPEHTTDLCVHAAGVKPSPQPKSGQHYDVVATLALGQALIGIGATPLYTLAVTWIDEYNPKGSASLYMGFFYTANILGPALAYLVGGYVLDHLHADFLNPNPALIIDSSSRMWIGAWWLLFLVPGLVMITHSCLLLFYPKNLQRDGPNEMYNINPSGEVNLSVLEVLRGLAHNSIYVSLCAVGVFETFILSSFNSFMSKYVQNQFGLSTKGSSIIMGCLIVPAGFLGIITGGCIIKRYQLSTFRLFLLIQSCLCLSLAFGAGFILVNDPVKFAGINYPYKPYLMARSIILDEISNQRSLESECNKHCSCDSTQYNPICGVDLITYYNPCFAGCMNETVGKHGLKIFFSCSCIPDQANDIEELDELIDEKHGTKLNKYRMLYVKELFDTLKDKLWGNASDIFDEILATNKSRTNQFDSMVTNPIVINDEVRHDVEKAAEILRKLKRERRFTDLEKRNNNISENYSNAKAENSKETLTILPPNPPSNGDFPDSSTPAIQHLSTSQAVCLVNHTSSQTSLMDMLTTCFPPVTSSCASSPRNEYSPLTSTVPMANPKTPQQGIQYFKQTHPSPENTTSNIKISAYGKPCPNTSAHVALFSVSTFFAFYLMFVCIMPATEGILRSVPFEFKSMALGVQWLLIRILATVPSSSLLAIFIDSSCLYWKQGEQYCILYDNYYFSRYLAAFAFYFRHLSIYIVLYMMFRVKINEAI